MAPLMQCLKDYFAAKRHLRAAIRLYRKGEFEGAVEEYRMSLSFRPGSAVTHFNLGLALYKLGQKQEAREEWKAVSALAEGKNPYLLEQAQIMLRQFG